MSKDPEALRTISEVAEELDLQAHVLRFWESKFKQLSPLKRRGGRRYYRPEDIDLLKAIKDLLYTQGLTIRGAQKALPAVLKHQKVVGDSAVGSLDEIINETDQSSDKNLSPDQRKRLTKIKEELKTLKASLDKAAA